MNLEALTPMLSKAKATSTPKVKPIRLEEEEIVIPDQYEPDTPVGEFIFLCHLQHSSCVASVGTYFYFYATTIQRLVKGYILLPMFVHLLVQANASGTGGNFCPVSEFVVS